MGVLYEDNGTVTFFYNVTGSYTIPPSSTNVQAPSVPIYNIVNIQFWEITDPNGFKQVYRTPTAFFTPRIEGLYTARVVAVTASTIPPQSVSVGPPGTFYYSNTGLYAFNNIPPITAVSPYFDVPTLSSYPISVPGYVLNTSLKGWDYSKSINQEFTRPVNAGAKPFWAKVHTQKDISTNYKGINKWGLPIRNLDTYNFITQPEFSDIILNAGDKITYERNYSTKLNWEQPVEIITQSDKKQWCDLQFSIDQPSNLAFILNNYKTELIVTPTLTASPILLQNYVDNEPVEVYYNALNSFIWGITAFSEIPITNTSDTSAKRVIQAGVPWANFSNQNYPTVAIFPTLKNLYSVSEKGGYSTPSNIGASVYADQNYLFTLTTYTSSLFNQTGIRRGLSKQDQPTPYTFIANSSWQKEPIVSGPIAGVNNKKVFKKFQKFIPYQSNYETNFRNQIGLLNPTSRQTPWTGKENSQWSDSANYPVSFTGELNVEKWAESQILKKAGLQVDSWVTDIFGNQYGLYKDIKGLSLLERSNVYGQIWVRGNTQFTSPAEKALVNVFDTYKNLSLFNELTGNGVKKLDMFFDTLMIVTSGVVLFEKINYDYSASNIFSLADEARYLSLALPVETSIDRELLNTDFSQTSYAKLGETWFLPVEKAIYISTCGLQNNILIPELYSLNISTQSLLKIFPLNTGDINTVQQLSSLNLVSFDAPTLAYNASKKQFLIGITGINSSNNKVLVEIKVNNFNFSQPTLEDIVVYNSITVTDLQEPPAVLANLNIQLDRPDPIGLQFTSVDSISAGSKLVLRRNINNTLTLATAPVVNNTLVYPATALTFINDSNTQNIFVEPIFNNYGIFALNPNYIEQYGDEELFGVQPLNFVCSPVIYTPAIFTSVSLPSWINLTQDGVFTGLVPDVSATNYTGVFKVENSVGPTFYTLNINIP